MKNIHLYIDIKQNQVSINIIQNIKVIIWGSIPITVLKDCENVYYFLRLLTEGRLHDRDNSWLRCCLCDINVQDKVSHYLFTCTSLQEMRHTEWQHIANAMPPAMAI